MNYKKVLGIRSTLFYGDINRVAQGNFYYPILKEQQLINVIKSGDYESARTIVDEIYEVNFKDNNITADSAQCLMLNLICTLIRAVNEISAQYKDNLLEDFDPINDLLPYKSAEELKYHLDKFLYSFCKYILRLNKNSSNWVVTDVVPFIENNYQDINLSVAQIAEQFDVHPAYISKTFKDTTGDGLLEFIHRTRVEKAKLLMQENRNTGLEEISTLVGFSNYRSFSRVFKKYEGITPGKYKDILCHPQSK
jgi:YesN/AraC family two-component response regulator